MASPFKSSKASGEPALHKQLSDALGHERGSPKADGAAAAKVPAGGPEAGLLKGDGKVQHRVMKGDVLGDMPSGP